MDIRRNITNNFFYKRWSYKGKEGFMKNLTIDTYSTKWSKNINKMWFIVLKYSSNPTVVVWELRSHLGLED